jgi:hypothetical protein
MCEKSHLVATEGEGSPSFLKPAAFGGGVGHAATFCTTSAQLTHATPHTHAHTHTHTDPRIPTHPTTNRTTQASEIIIFLGVSADGDLCTLRNPSLKI